MQRDLTVVDMIRALNTDENKKNQIISRLETNDKDVYNRDMNMQIQIEELEEKIEDLERLEKDLEKKIEKYKKREKTYKIVLRDMITIL